MQLLSLCRRFILPVLLILPTMAFAHHGWSWTTGGNIQLTGVIVETRLGNPHGRLVIRVNDELWTAEVGQPWRNERAGLQDSDLAPGTEIKIEGEPSANVEDKLIKVERLWINGTRYELYPNRS